MHVMNMRIWPSVTTLTFQTNYLVTAWVCMNSLITKGEKKLNRFIDVNVCKSGVVSYWKSFLIALKKQKRQLRRRGTITVSARDLCHLDVGGGGRGSEVRIDRSHLRLWPGFYHVASLLRFPMSGTRRRSTYPCLSVPPAAVT